MRTLIKKLLLCMLWLFALKHEDICYVSHSAKIQVFAFYGPLVTNWSSESKVNVTKRERIKSLRNLFCKQKIVKKSRENMVVTTQKDKEETKPMLGLVDFASGGVHKVSLSLRFIIATVTGHWFPWDCKIGSLTFLKLHSYPFPFLSV